MVKRYLDKIKKENKKINAILQLNEDLTNSKKGKLSGKVIAVKANINVRGMNCNCASKTLENYKAPYDATVVRKIKEQGGIIIGVANMDEFACGSSGETSAFGPVKNPVALGLIPGGSSSGSAVAVAAGFCDVALGSDTGGSIRNPASSCGVVGVKPSYSSVSRYGLMDLSMSLDQIGPIAKNVKDAALLLSVIQGKDEKDAISQESKKINLNEIEKTPKQIKIGVLDFEIENKEIQNLIDNKVEQVCKNYGWEKDKIKIENIDLGVASYYILVYVELFSSTRRYDGRRYGKKIEEVAGPEVLRRILGGSEISKAEYHGRYYHLALNAKKLIEKEFEKAFKKFDCIISPTVPRLPWKIGEEISVEEAYASDVLTVPANLAGCCAISIPAGKISNIPVGLQIMCDKFEDEKMLRIARGIEKLG